LLIGGSNKKFAANHIFLYLLRNEFSGLQLYIFFLMIAKSLTCKASWLKYSFFLTITLLAGFFHSFAGDIKFTDSWGKAGYTVESQNGSKVLLNYSIKAFSLSDFQVNGESMQNLELPGHFLPNNAGAPNLPGSGRYIAIPQGAEASFNIVSYRSETFTNVNIAPAFRIPWANEDEDLEYIKDESIYSANKFYPEEPILLSEKGLVRGIDVVMLGITPFHYNPITHQLIVYRDLNAIGFVVPESNKE